MSIKEICHELPKPIFNVLLATEGWLVGSAVSSMINDENPRDYDIIVPANKWRLVNAVLNGTPFKLNSFGGLKYTTNTWELDIWPEELDHFLKTCLKFEYALNISNYILLKSL